MADFLILATASFFAGMLNTMAGGGTFLTFPALVYTGVPLISANATSAVAVFPGYVGGAIGFWREIVAQGGVRLRMLVAATIIGGIGGSCLLLFSAESAFEFAVPFLLAFATITFAFADRLRAWAHRTKSGDKSLFAGAAAAAVYGGYFNGGLGIVLLALFSWSGMTDLIRMNGLKNFLSVILSGISLVVFAAADLVAWPQAVTMMVAALVGGYAAAPLSRLLPRSVIRAMVIMTGAVMCVVFFWNWIK